MRLLTDRHEEFIAHRVMFRVLKLTDDHVVDGTKGGPKRNDKECEDGHRHILI